MIKLERKRLNKNKTIIVSIIAFICVIFICTMLRNIDKKNFNSKFLKYEKNEKSDIYTVQDYSGLIKEIENNNRNRKKRVYIKYRNLKNDFLDDTKKNAGMLTSEYFAINEYHKNGYLSEIVISKFNQYERQNLKAYEGKKMGKDVKYLLENIVKKKLTTIGIDAKYIDKDYTEIKIDSVGKDLSDNKEILNSVIENINENHVYLVTVEQGDSDIIINYNENG